MISEQQKQTICWDCRKATGGKGCNWAEKFEPVNELQIAISCKNARCSRRGD